MRISVVIISNRPSSLFRCYFYQQKKNIFLLDVLEKGEEEKEGEKQIRNYQM